jgi:hypothetical protein
VVKNDYDELFPADQKNDLNLLCETTWRCSIDQESFSSVRGVMKEKEKEKEKKKGNKCSDTGREGYSHTHMVRPPIQWKRE